MHIRTTVKVAAHLCEHELGGHKHCGGLCGPEGLDGYERGRHVLKKHMLRRREEVHAVHLRGSPNEFIVVQELEVLAEGVDEGHLAFFSPRQENRVIGAPQQLTRTFWKTREKIARSCISPYISSAVTRGALAFRLGLELEEQAAVAARAQHTQDTIFAVECEPLACAMGMMGRE